MSPDLDKFSDAQDYTGKSSIIIGNGLGLPISHIGTVEFKTPTSIIPLKNTLCVPKLKQNLLSLQSLTKDINSENTELINSSTLDNNTTSKEVVLNSSNEGRVNRNTSEVSEDIIKKFATLSIRDNETQPIKEITSQATTTFQVVARTKSGRAIKLPVNLGIYEVNLLKALVAEVLEEKLKEPKNFKEAVLLPHWRKAMEISSKL